jgi:ABC-type polysaccharide transport system permease subunit
LEQACTSRWKTRIEDHNLLNNHYRFLEKVSNVMFLTKHTTHAVFYMSALIWKEGGIREQQGRVSGHFWVASQDGVLPAETNAVNVDTASTAGKIHRVILPRSKKAILNGRPRKKGVGVCLRSE